MPDVALANCSIHRPLHLPGVEVIVAKPALRSFPARVSAGLGVCVKRGGAHDVRVEGRRERYPTDAVSLRTPGCLWSSEPGVHGFVSVDVAEDLLPPEWSGAPMGFVARGDLPDVAVCARRMVCAGDALEADEALTQLLGAVLVSAVLSSDAVREASGPAAAVRDACEFLRGNVAGRPTLDAVASAAGLSKFVLLRRFRATLGTTPHAYLVMVRVGHAQRLLAAGASPAEAAVQAGFADQSHLGLWFRRIVGVTPAAYRRQARTAISF